MSRSRTFGLAVSIVAAACMLHATVRSQELEEKEVHGRRDIADEPVALFREIEKAWQGEDAGGISHYTANSKVYLNVKGMMRKGGYFSKSQVYYLFKNLFRNNKQTRFKFFQFENLDKPDRRVYGIAYNDYKSVNSGRLFKDKVYVTLSKEGERWVVSEIKTTW